ncbi:Crp/Fnr family transcriptional regulator [Ihubacter sp. rT4E-8]|uniref:Crp/Fnr family transcriptional regulator n=1 Tax=unclassified Ihubacter TaxID=2633299 RepID=UPI001379ADA3
MEEFFGNVLNLSDPELIRSLCEISDTVKMEKGTVIIRQEERLNAVMLVLKGIYRGYYLDAEGKEITDCFGLSIGEPVIPCSLFNEPSEITIECIAEGSCLRIDLAGLTALVRRKSWHAELLECYNRFLIQGIKRHQRHKRVIHDCDAVGRYRWFLREYPGLIDVISHKDIASFIGMTPVTLSKLRGKLRAKEVVNA